MISFSTTQLENNLWKNSQKSWWKHLMNSLIIYIYYKSAPSSSKTKVTLTWSSSSCVNWNFSSPSSTWATSFDTNRCPRCTCTWFRCTWTLSTIIIDLNLYFNFSASLSTSSLSLWDWRLYQNQGKGIGLDKGFFCQGVYSWRSSQIKFK